MSMTVNFKSFLRRHWTLAQFLAVGGSGVIVNLALLTAFKFLLGDSLILVANAIAVEASILNNFVWNDRFTFRHRHVNTSEHNLQGKLRRLLKYNFVSLTSFAANEIVFYFLTTRFYAVMVSLATLLLPASYYYLPASLIAIFVSFVVNYFGSSRWAWRHQAKLVQTAAPKAPADAK